MLEDYEEKCGYCRKGCSVCNRTNIVKVLYNEKEGWWTPKNRKFTVLWRTVSDDRWLNGEVLEITVECYGETKTELLIEHSTLEPKRDAIAKVAKKLLKSIVKSKLKELHQNKFWWEELKSEVY